MNSWIKFYDYRLILTILILLGIFAGCGCLSKKTILVSRDLSPGLKYDDRIFFICYYSIDTPGTTLFPMYFYIKGDNLFHELWLYEYNVKDTSLIKRHFFEFSKREDYSPDLDSINWLLSNDYIYIKIPEWRNKNFQMVQFNLKDNSISYLNESEKEKILKRMDSVIKQEGLLSKHAILATVDFIPFQKWNLKSPFEVYRYSLSECKNMIIEAKAGGYLFREIIFDRLKKECSGTELARIAKEIKKRYNKLESYDRSVYHPYMEVWWTRLRLEATYGKSKRQDDLARAIYQHDNVMAKNLLAQTTDFEHPDSEGTTLLMIAALCDNYEIAEVLLSKANINARDSMGCTPLMYAVFGNSFKVMKLLMENKADTTLCSSSNYTAWMHINNDGLRTAYRRIEDKK
ncbi:MAG: ankyrin repeat domain-containing protein [Spirochaetes bacterium]|nr:ankyrin repeat domain-containing protein [Spirochaetota bacterium]